jgi:hypothetical protein
MAGTQLQEIGHDAVIVAFVQNVLTPLHDRAVYLVNPAIGPKRDIYFAEKAGCRYTSAYCVSRGDYIPAFQYRFQLSDAEMAKLEASSRYLEQEWYVRLSHQMSKDLATHLIEICKALEARLHSDLPDIIAIDPAGALIGFAEVKFEGFSLKARASVLLEYELARELGIPYHLAIPKYPSYSREVTNSWLRHNLPGGLTVFKFEIPKGVVLPKQSTILFVPLEPKLQASTLQATGIGR